MTLVELVLSDPSTSDEPLLKRVYSKPSKEDSVVTKRPWPTSPLHLTLTSSSLSPLELLDLIPLLTGVLEIDGIPDSIDEDKLGRTNIHVDFAIGPDGSILSIDPNSVAAAAKLRVI